MSTGAASAASAPRTSVFGAFPALIYAPVLTYFSVRSAPVLAYHPELHSNTEVLGQWFSFYSQLRIGIL